MILKVEEFWKKENKENIFSWLLIPFVHLVPLFNETVFYNSYLCGDYFYNKSGFNKSCIYK